MSLSQEIFEGGDRPDRVGRKLVYRMSLSQEIFEGGGEGRDGRKLV